MIWPFAFINQYVLMDGPLRDTSSSWFSLTSMLEIRSSSNNTTSLSSILLRYIHYTLYSVIRKISKNHRCLMAAMFFSTLYNKLFDFLCPYFFIHVQHLTSDPIPRLLMLLPLRRLAAASAKQDEYQQNHAYILNHSNPLLLRSPIFPSVYKQYSTFLVCCQFIPSF